MQYYSSLSNDNLAEALRYASHGYKVYPVWGIQDGKCLCGGINGCRPGKHPCGRLVPHGEKEATTDPDTIRRWFKGSGVNVGISIDGFVVLDFDKKHGGMETLTDWECRFGAMPRTPTVASGGGGRHFYFARPNVPLNPKPARGVDCLWGNGGGLISPPSLHECGGRYSWLVPLETPVAEMPTRLVEIIRLASAPQPKPTKAFAFNPMKGVVASGQTFADLGRFPPGSRYEPVKKTIGSMLGNGYTREQILEDGLAWADRQEPPYSADELREKVRWCASKQGVKITDLEYPQNEPLHKNEAVEPTAIRFSPFAPDAGEKDNPPTPVQPIHGKAYHGLLGEMLRAVEGEMEANPPGALLGWMTLLGNVIGRGAYFVVRGRHHHPALYLANVGGTGDGKEDTWDVIIYPFAQVEAEWVASRIMGVGSGEGLIEQVGDVPHGA